jgi:hypothetical protein
MRKQSWWTLILVVVACLCLASGTRGAKPSTKTTWEYRVISVYGPSVTTPAPDVQQLNNAGAEGWELIAIRSANFPEEKSQQVRTDYFFKR